MWVSFKDVHILEFKLLFFVLGGKWVIMRKWHICEVKKGASNILFVGNFMNQHQHTANNFSVFFFLLLFFS